MPFPSTFVQEAVCDPPFACRIAFTQELVGMIVVPVEDAAAILEVGIVPKKTLLREPYEKTKPRREGTTEALVLNIISDLSNQLPALL